MSDPTWGSKTFFDFVWNLLNVMLIERAEREALVEALGLAGVLPPEQYENIRQAKRQAAIETIRKLSQEGESAWLRILQEFEGPVQ